MLTFNLVGTVPRELIPLCLDHMPRPWWETSLHKLLFVTGVLLVLCASVMAYTDASVMAARRQPPPPDLQPRFDLRTIKPDLESEEDKHAGDEGDKTAAPERLVCLITQLSQ